jgi:hypothetical protein
MRHGAEIGVFLVRRFLLAAYRNEIKSLLQLRLRTVLQLKRQKGTQARAQWRHANVAGI